MTTAEALDVSLRLALDDLTIELAELGHGDLWRLLHRDLYAVPDTSLCPKEPK
jgi:hypothetical protein